MATVTRVETLSVHLDYLRELAGPDMAKSYVNYCKPHDRWYVATDEQRKRQRMRRATWWMSPSDTYDRATVMMPRLLKNRMDELGIDFAVMYPSIGLNFHRINSEDMRKAVVRSYNIMTRDFLPITKTSLRPPALLRRSRPKRPWMKRDS